MGNNNSVMAQRRATRHRATNSASDISMPDTDTAVSQREADTEMESSTGVHRRRSRFSSLRNAFKTNRDIASDRTNTADTDHGQSTSSTNSDHTIPIRNRTRRSMFGSEFFSPPSSDEQVSGTPNTLATDSEQPPDLSTDRHAPDVSDIVQPPLWHVASPGSPTNDVVGSITSTVATPIATLANSRSASQTSLPTSTSLPSLVPQRRRLLAPENMNGRRVTRSRHSDDAITSRPSSRLSGLSHDIQDDSRSGEVVSPMPGEDQAGMLSRLLSVAAAATAASLVGHGNRQALRDAREVAIGAQSAHTEMSEDRTSTNERPVTSSSGSQESRDADLVDGSFDGFLAALQSGRLAQALRNGGNTLGGGTSDLSAHQPLNFFRMFRFSNAVSIHGSPAPNEGDGRMIPIIIVGIRSVPSRTEAGVATGEVVPPFFDALGSLNSLRSGESRDAPSTSESQQADQTESVLADRMSAISSDITAGEVANDGGSSGTEATVPIINTVSEPPFTVADSLSSESMQNSTFPNQALRSDSSSSIDGSAQATRPIRPASGLMDSVLDRLRSFRTDSTDNTSNQTEEHTRRRRRRSTWRPFSNNGSQESEEATEAAPGTTRSWIIYVLGGTYPENHPILTTPSLFTDSPTYEDMLLLSNLLGPAKPETAIASDLESAGTPCIYGELEDQTETRCQICLSDYVLGDPCRKLSKCSHYFHQECIDEWLTTGRNNCPLCRTGTDARTQASEGVASETNPTEAVPADSLHV